MSTQVRPGYKLTEAGVIPEDWEIKSLQQMCREQITYGIVQCGPHLPTGVPYIRVSDMNSDELRLEGMLRTSPEIANRFSRSRVDEGDIVYALRGKLGEVRYVNAELVGANLTQGTARLAPNTTIEGRYLLWCLRNEQLIKRTDLDAKGSTFREITLADLRRQQIPVPQKTEQRAIAAALSDIDALISGLDQLIAKKNDIKQAAMQQLLTGKQRLPGFSGEWEMKRLESISAFITKGSTPTTFGFGWVTQGVLFLRSECVSASGLDLSQAMFISREAHTSLRRSEIKAGDLLMTITGNVGRTILLDSHCDGANINQHIARIRISCEKIDRRFVFHYLSRKEIRESLEKITTGQAYPQLSLKQVRELVVKLPTLAEQTAIANALSEMAAELAALEARRDKARQLKQGMMQELLTGRIRLL